jgi:hypothetical protein
VHEHHNWNTNRPHISTLHTTCCQQRLRHCSRLVLLPTAVTAGTRCCPTCPSLSPVGEPTSTAGALPFLRGDLEPPVSFRSTSTMRAVAIIVLSALLLCVALCVLVPSKSISPGALPRPTCKNSHNSAVISGMASSKPVCLTHVVCTHVAHGLSADMTIHRIQCKFVLQALHRRQRNSEVVGAAMHSRCRTAHHAATDYSTSLP